MGLEIPSGDLRKRRFERDIKRWIRPSKLMAYEDGIFTIGLPDEYTIRWWEDRLSSLIVRQLRGSVMVQLL